MLARKIGSLHSSASTEHHQVPAGHTLLDQLESEIKSSEHDVVKHVVTLAGDTKTAAVDVYQQAKVIAAEGVGVAELAGLRYHVKAYEAQVDGGLYRGSRLDDAGMASLQKEGIKGVISLCLEHTNDAALASKYGLAFLNVKILDNHAPTMAQMMDFINFAKAHPPAYVHCEAGVGRTGTAVACYRIYVDGWTADKAIAEAHTYGLQLVNQIAFIQSFATTVRAGKS